MCYAQSATRLRKRSVADSGSQHSHRSRCEIPGIFLTTSMVGRNIWQNFIFLFLGARQNPVRIRRSESVGELAHQRQGRDIFAKGEIPGRAHEKDPIHIPPFVRRGELRSPAGVQRTPLRSKKRFYKNFFNILQSVPKCAIINLLIGDGTHNKKRH